MMIKGFQSHFVFQVVDSICYAQPNHNKTYCIRLNSTNSNRFGESLFYSSGKTENAKWQNSKVGCCSGVTAINTVRQTFYFADKMFS